MPAVTMLLALIVLYGLSCSSGGGRAMPLLETADSLMLSDPDAARQMLLSVEQGTDLRMNRSERAYYLLLMAEADYLCEKSPLGDTAVREAVQFFRSGGQQGLYARALMMQGTVYQGIADTLSSLVSCWDSLSADDVSGRREVAGLLRSIVENACGLMFGGYAGRYMAAVDSLDRNVGMEQSVQTCLSLAGGLAAYAAGQAEDNVAEGIETARKAGDEKAMFFGEDLQRRLNGRLAGERMDLETLRLAALVLENENLKIQAMETRVNVLTSLLVLAVVLLVSLAVSYMFYIRIRKLRMEYAVLKASIETFDPAAVGADVPAAVEAGGEAGTEIEAVLRDMVSLIGEMNEICGRDNDGAASASEIKNLLDKHFPENEVNARIRRICDLLYPGVLSGIERDYPSLTRNDILLIALMACGFPTGAICAIRRLNVHSLNVQKTRTARKIAPGLRLADFVSRKFNKSAT